MRHKSWRVDEIKQQTIKSGASYLRLYGFQSVLAFQEFEEKMKKLLTIVSFSSISSFPVFHPNSGFHNSSPSAFATLGWKLNPLKCALGLAATLPFIKIITRSVDIFYSAMGAKSKPVILAVYCIFGVIYTITKPATWVVSCPECFEKIIAP